ncbi:hypothetical protein AOLI_G00221970 [Acnodon oligacanthus]
MLRSSSGSRESLSSSASPPADLFGEERVYNTAAQNRFPGLLPSALGLGQSVVIQLKLAVLRQQVIRLI